MLKFHTGTALFSLVLFAGLCPGQSTGSRSAKKGAKKDDVYKLKVDPKSPGDQGAIELLRKVSRKYQTSQPYAFAGDLEVAQHTGEDPRVVLAKGKIKLTAAPGGKFDVHVENADKSPGATFDLVSDGSKRWVWSPGSNQYTVRDAKATEAVGVAVKAIENGQQPEPRDIVGEFALELIPTLAGLPSSAQVSFYRGSVLTVMSKKDEAQRQTLLYLTVNPESLAISKLTLMKAFLVKGAKTLVRFDLSFQKFTVGETDSSAQFKFDPPAEAKLVDTLPTDIHPEEAAPQSDPKPQAQTPPQP